MLLVFSIVILTALAYVYLEFFVRLLFSILTVYLLLSIVAAVIYIPLKIYNAYRPKKSYFSEGWTERFKKNCKEFFRKKVKVEPA